MTERQLFVIAWTHKKTGVKQQDNEPLAKKEVEVWANRMNELYPNINHYPAPLKNPDEKLLDPLIGDRYCPHCGETHIAIDDSVCHHCQKPLYNY